MLWVSPEKLQLPFRVTTSIPCKAEHQLTLSPQVAFVMITSVMIGMVSLTPWRSRGSHGLTYV